MGVFEKIFTALSENTQDTSLLMIDATHLKAHIVECLSGAQQR